jgi:hypothetical protein
MASRLINTQSVHSWNNVNVPLVPDIHFELVLVLWPVGVVAMVDVSVPEAVLVEDVVSTNELFSLTAASAIPIPLVDFGGGKVHLFGKALEHSLRPLVGVRTELFLEVVLL